VYASKIARAYLALAAAGAALVIALVPSPSRAAADDATKKDQKKMPSYPALMEMKPTEVMIMMDVDKDGNVTRAEFMKFYEGLYDRLDRDKNQRLSAPEFTDRG
jgi:hypothetical protein